MFGNGFRPLVLGVASNQHLLEVEDERFWLWWDKGLKVEGYDLENERLALNLSGLLPRLGMHALLALDHSLKQGGSKQRLAKLLKSYSSKKPSKNSDDDLLRQLHVVRSGASIDKMLIAPQMRDPWSIEMLLIDKDPMVRKQLLQNPLLTSYQMVRLHKDEDQSVRMQTFAHPKAKIEWLTKAIEEEENAAIDFLCSNPSAPSELLETLFVESSLNMPHQCTEAYYCKHGVGTCQRRLSSLLKNPGLKEAVIMREFSHLCHKYWESQLGARKDMSLGLRHMAITHPSEDSRKKVAQIWNLTLGEQQTLLKDNVNVRRSLSRNNSLYFSTYLRLYFDKYINVHNELVFREPGNGIKAFMKSLRELEKK